MWSLQINDISWIFKDLKKLRFVLDNDQNVAYCQVPKCGSTSWSVAFAEANKMDNYKDYLNGKLTHFCPTANICVQQSSDL